MDGCLASLAVLNSQTHQTDKLEKLPRNTVKYDKQHWFLRAVDKVKNLGNLIFIVSAIGQEMDMNLCSAADKSRCCWLQQCNISVAL